MRKPIIIISSILGVIVLAVIAVFIYAAANLNSLIAQNRDMVLAKVGDAMGRNVQVDTIKAQLGWGVSAELSKLRISDDPRFSQKPFVSAEDVSAQVELMPLLTRQIRISRIVLHKPEIHIIRDANGKLNVSSIGKKPGQAPAAAKSPSAAKPSGGAEGGPMTAAPEKAARTPSILESLLVRNFSIDQGKVTFDDASGEPITISAIDLDVNDFSFTSPFVIALHLAAFGDTQNVALTGSVGPVMSGGAIDATGLPVELKLNVGPFALDQLRKVAMVSKSIPPKLTISDTFGLDTTIKGKLDALKIHAASDMSSNEIAFGDSFHKPAGTTLKVDADAERSGNAVEVALAQVALAELQLKATKISLGGGKFAGRIDTNKFDIGSLSKFSPAAAKMGVTGSAEVHTDVAYASGNPTANGTITLASVTVPRPGGKGGNAVSNLSGDIKLAGTAADVGPLTFLLGTGNATLKAHAAPIYPPKVSYDFTADTLHTADFAEARPADEQLNQVKATGTFEMKAIGADVEDKLTSSSGLLNNVAYKDLVLDTSLEGKRMRVLQLSVAAFSGTVVATAETQLEPSAPFTTSVSLSNVDVQQAMQSQKLKAADMVRGLLSGRVQLAGKTGKFDEMKQSFDGNGKIQLVQGKLVGINVAATALKKVDKLPAIGALVPESVVNNHPELFKNPDTDIQQANLSFVIQGPRITSHDINVQTVDYAMTGDGWFDMDKNIDMDARILLSPSLTKEIIAQKQQVTYVTNRQGQVDIPLHISGQLPKPLVVPNVADLAQRAGRQAIQQQGEKAIGKFLGKKGLGGFLGGGGSAGGAAPSGGASPASTPNPLDQLKKLF